MKVYVCTDLEGVAGVTSFGEQADPNGRYYEQAKLLLTAEVNAAVEGMLSSGVDDVLIADYHGPGAIAFEELHPAAKLLHGRPLAPWAALAEVTGQYDVCMMIGQHAMAGVARGNLNHTMNSKAVDYYTLNGKPVGEIALFSLYSGDLGQPMIFLSGDDAACREAEELIPGAVTVEVKKSLSRNSAISFSQAESHRRIREGVVQAIEAHRKNPLPPLQWPGPYVLEKRFFHTDLADMYASNPNAERIDSQTIRLRAEKIRDIVYA